MEEDDEIIRNYSTDVHCGYCGQQCSPGNIKLLERRGEFWVLSIFCESCRKQGFITAIVKKSEAPEADIELTEEEIAKFCTPICSDDVLDMYSFLDDFGGDFLGLFPDIKLADADNHK